MLNDHDKMTFGPFEVPRVKTTVDVTPDDYRDLLMLAMSIKRTKRRAFADHEEWTPEQISDFRDIAQEALDQVEVEMDTAQLMALLQSGDGRGVHR